MSWGHAVSPDLAHWKQLPVALAEENGVAIFSGSTIEDLTNTSGLCGDPSPKSPGCLIAIYTGTSQDKQTQNLASSRDGGTTWTKYPSNPVLDGSRPQGFPLHQSLLAASSQSWVMVVALPAQHKLRFYRSKNLCHGKWPADSAPPAQSQACGSAPTSSNSLSAMPRETRSPAARLLTVNVNPGGPAAGPADQYFVGQFDGYRFVEDHPAPVRTGPLGQGLDASTSFSNLPPDKDHIWIAWMSNWQYAAKLPSWPGRGEMTVARRLDFHQSPAHPALSPSQGRCCCCRPILPIPTKSDTQPCSALRPFRQSSRPRPHCRSQAVRKRLSAQLHPQPRRR